MALHAIFLRYFWRMFSLSNILEIAFWVFVVASALQVVYALVFQLHFVLFKDKTSLGEPEPVSVIIASRNEEDNLKAHLPLWMEQEGVDFELIIADDCSVDETPYLLKEWVKQYPRLKYTRIEESRTFEGGKKFALTMGIKAAKNENLVFTDADCKPTSKHWLRTMASALNNRKIVLGYAPFTKEGGFLNKLIRFDAFAIGVQYLSFAINHIPYMGVGRNMAYKSFLFFDNKGFSRHYDIKSGDDDLFINSVANSSNTCVVLNPETYMYSAAKPSFSEWFTQKKRHLSTAGRYKALHLFLLGLLSISQYLSIGLFVALLIAQWRWQEVLIVFGIKFFVQQLITLLALRKTKELDLWPISFFYEFFHIVFYPSIVIVRIIDKSNAWKK